MFPKRSRLRAEEVKSVLSRGTSMRVGPYTGKFLAGRKVLGIAVIVPKREVRGAVERNRLRRKAYRDVAKEKLPLSGALALFVRK